MKLKELYSKSIERAVNPAVSATKFDEETERIEIQEYVFTDEIMNGLYRILDAIKNNKPYDHVGIWIDGYYGSGKSHFLKYLDYCITPHTQEAALSRLLEAVKGVDPMDDKHSLQFDYSQIESIARWLKQATVDTCIFNLETSYDNSMDKKKAFLHVFWNEFNGKRGFNKYNLTLAQTLEKPLAEKGVFDAFKQRIAEIGGDWDNQSDAADMIDNELGMVLDIANELAPSLDKESIRERIIKRDVVVSIDKFAMELASYLKDKGDNYRLIMLADEVSQFINKEKDRYLNLQEIITKLSEACGNKVWIACTAQQDLSEIMDDCHIAEEMDKEGKIKGRFEVKVSLKGTQPEVITQKRILDKKEEVKEDLGDLYDDIKSSFDLQFKLPTSYDGYADKNDFVAYYPFVPYQFKLIMQVFNSFLNLGYVAKEVKGNERSIIKVIHATAKKSMDENVGKFIAFDELYNNMFEEGLQARGQRAIDNAISMAMNYQEDVVLAKRVTNVLFMICNISATDQLVFPSTLDNITSLLVNDVTTPRLNIKNAVEGVLDFLCEKNIIHKEQGKQGAPDTYQFYSEEEMKVAELIKNQQVDVSTQADQLREIFLKYFNNLKAKESYCTRSFSVGLIIKQRKYLSNTPDVVVEFEMDVEPDVENADMLAMRNHMPNKMIFYLGPQFRNNKRLYNNFYWFCKVQQYTATPVTNEDNAKTRREFGKRAQELLDTIIVPEFQKLLDTCPIISSNLVMNDAELMGKRGPDRYHVAIQKHFSLIYPKAVLVDSPSIPRNTEALRGKILRVINPEEYSGLNVMIAAERSVDNYLNGVAYGEVNVSEVEAYFAKPPYGWDKLCTLYVVNELVRRHRWEYSYGNNPDVSRSVVANKIITETNKFTLRRAAEIPQELLKKFVASWKDIFGISVVLPTNDSSQLFRECRSAEYEYGLEKFIKQYNRLITENYHYPFVEPLRGAIEMFEKWLQERDAVKFFNMVIDDQQEGRRRMDICKDVIKFIQDQKERYLEIRAFVKDNNDNFAYVPDSLREQVAAIRKIDTAEWPIRIREYIKMQKALNEAIEAKKCEVKDRVCKAYDEVYATLEQCCEAEGVYTTVLSNKDAMLQSKIQTNSIAMLEVNCNTNDFYAEQYERIQKAKQPKVVPPTNTPGGGKVETPPQPKVKKPRMVQLKTRTISPLKSEVDVDAYLADLKKQLMKEIEGGESVMIIK